MVIFQGTGGESQVWQSRSPGRAGASTAQPGFGAFPEGPGTNDEGKRESTKNPTDARELLPGLSNETAGTIGPGFFMGR